MGRQLIDEVLAAAVISVLAMVALVMAQPDSRDPTGQGAPASQASAASGEPADPVASPSADAGPGALALAQVDPTDSAPEPAPGGPAESAAPASPAPAPPSATPSAASAEDPVASPGWRSGLLTFRGSPSRTFYGTGPIPGEVEVAWRHPQRAMCANSTVGEETRQWCGTGWTGQPAVFPHEGRTWVVFGGYDRAVHFVDADTGEAILEPLFTGDIIKGSVTIDPDGYPIVYSGSRDGRYRAIAIDGETPRELWALSSADATGPTRWNDDWDGAGLVVDGHLLIGGENSRLFVVRLNRGYSGDGSVEMAPEVLADVAGWDEDLLAALGDGNVSFESSVAYRDGVIYATNSGGLVQGWDVGEVLAGVPDAQPERVLRWWMGDDTDATLVVDPEGMVYVAAEWERSTARSAEVGQVAKLDPSRPEDPLVWSVTDPALADGARPEVAGVWGTPALWEDLLLVPMTGGQLLALSTADGTERWRLSLGDHLWSSPVVVDGTLLQGDCAGSLHAFDLTAGDDGPPPGRWSLSIGGCVESTPAVWEGRIYVGTRAGHVVAVAAPTVPPGA